MFYSNEINLQNIKTVPFMVQAMLDAGIDRYFQVSELMATPRELVPAEQALENFKEEFTIQIEGIDVTVTSSLRYQSYINIGTKEIVRSELLEAVTVPFNGLVIRRANKKRGVESLRLNQRMLNDNEDYKVIVKNHKERVLLAKLEAIANQVIDARNLKVIDERKAAEYSLHIDYDNTSKENKNQFLIDNNFSGLNNLDVYDSRPDGYGHTTGRCTQIDFDSKSISVIGFSSDD